MAPLYIFLILSFLLPDQASSLGINYGQVGNNLPPPDKVLELLRALRITKVRIYDTSPQILSTFASSGVEVQVTIENQMLPVVTDPQQALQWVTTHIQPYFPATRITGISVGNEIFSNDDSSLNGYLVPAITSIHSALVQVGLDRYIQVSTPNSLAVLQNSYPPSAGSFKPEVSDFMTQYLQFLSATSSPFWINAYPFFAYKDNPARISLDYALCNRNQGMVDPNTRLRYDNMLYAQVDAVLFAMARLGFSDIEIRVSETGWPSKGDADEVGATVQNAAVYNRNLVRRQMRNEGTPLRPSSRLEVYLFALFNEDLKPGPTSERNYGLFQPDGKMAYNVGLSSAMSTSTPSSLSTSSATISLTSLSTKIARVDHQSMAYLMLVHLALEVLMRRHF